MSVQTRLLLSPCYGVEPIKCGTIASIASRMASADLLRDVAYRYLVGTTSSGASEKFRFNESKVLIEHCKKIENSVMEVASVDLASVSLALRPSLVFGGGKTQLTEWILRLTKEQDRVGSDGEDTFALSNFVIEIFGYGSLTGSERKVLLDWVVTDERIVNLVNDLDGLLPKQSAPEITVDPLPENCRKHVGLNGHVWYAAISTE